MSNESQSDNEWGSDRGSMENHDRSLLSIKVDSVAIDDKEFDVWLENKLDIALESHQMKNPQVLVAGIQPQIQDYFGCWHQR